jgi:hypothetical protein
MLDVDGDGRVTHDEFLSVVKEGMAVERAQVCARACCLCTAFLVTACTQLQFGRTLAISWH